MCGIVRTGLLHAAAAHRQTGRAPFRSRGKLDGFTSASPVFLSKLKQRFNLVMWNDGSVSAPPFFLSKSKLLL